MNRRTEIDKEMLDLHYLQKIMRSLFPKNNDFASLSDLDELIPELKFFSIVTKLQVRLLLKKHRRQLLSIDNEPLDTCHQRIYREEMGNEEYLDAIRRQYWFSYPALIRTALEIEFGHQYEKFANERDGI